LHNNYPSDYVIAMRKAVDSVVVDDSCHRLATETIFSLRERRVRIYCVLSLVSYDDILTFE